MKLERLLVPVDFSENSTPAIEAALALAQPADGSITLIHVLEPIIIPYGESLPIEPPADVVRREGAEAEMERLRARYAQEGKLETLVLSGSAWDTICETASHNHTDLIVLTSHGRTGLSRLLMGSTAERIVRHARGPVLVLKSFKESTSA
jgi:nucleotide-binding universal stress UspA family protein